MTREELLQFPRPTSGILRATALALLVFAVGMAPSPPVELPPPLPLWELIDAPTYPDRARAAQQPWFTREQKIRFHPASLQALRDIGTPLTAKVVVELIGNGTHELSIQSRTAGALNSTVVIARVQHVPEGDLTLVIKDTVVAGTMHLGKRVLKIEYVGDGDHHLVELDPEKLPPD